MKILLTTILIFQIIVLVGQTNEIQKFQNDLIKNQLMKYEGETRISTSIDTPWMEYHLRRLFPDSTESTLTFKSAATKDSIVLTEAERDLILSFFQNPDNLKLSMNPTEFSTIEIDSALNHLKDDHDNQVVFISRPLFIRDDKIGVAFFSNLCCGHIYGHVNFSFYQTENEIWTRWIDISSGAF
ncbi:MAG: hypothetical protein RIC95_09690 [Vicingaceae bacterium]